MINNTVMTHTTIDHLPSIIFLVGPTATGKSSLAFQLAEKVNAHILSADSRQVYKGLEITSGADVPATFSPTPRHPEPGHRPSLSGSDLLQTYFESTDNQKSTKLFGVSLLNPTEEWSISQFREYALSIIELCKIEKKNLIVVGGSGLYLQSLLIDDPKLNIPPNNDLRQELAALSLTELQEKLSQINHQHFTKLNNSDLNNPRRLIRAIEMFSSPRRDAINGVSTKKSIHALEQHWFGLEIDNEILQQRINQRVVERTQLGALTEVEKLLNQQVETRFITSPPPVFTTTGVKEIRAFLNNQIEKEELVDLWTLREFKYAKRQKTWFKKRSQIEWISFDNPDASKLIEKKVMMGKR